MKLENLYKICLFIGILTVIIPAACALGVSPASKTVDFQPGQSVVVDFALVNSESAEGSVALSAQGELSSLVTFEEREVSLVGARVPFRARIDFPQSLEPGSHTLTIKAAPVLEQQTGTINAIISPEIAVRVRVPYPHKYLDADLVVLPAAEGAPLQLYAEYENMGDSDIAAAASTATIFSPQGAISAELSAEAVPLSKGSFHKQLLSPAPVLKGDYLVIADVSYDGNAVQIVHNFSFGEPKVTARLKTGTLVAGEINRVVFEIGSDWNAPLDAGGKIRLGDKEAELNRFIIQNSSLEGFILPDKAGDYNLTLQVLHSRGSFEQTYTVVVEDRLEIGGVSIGYVALVAGLGLMLIGVVILVLRRRVRT